MKLKGKITVLINRDYTAIEIEDDESNVIFARIKLSPEQLSSALSRMASTDCELEIFGLEKIGKKHECDKFSFEIPNHVKYDRYNSQIGTDSLRDHAQHLLDELKPGEGWVVEDYFGSQGSFFEKVGKPFAKVTIRRWI